MGIDGLHVRPGGLILVTHSAKSMMDTVRVDPPTGEQNGNATIVASGLTGADDFELDNKGRMRVSC